MLGNGLAWSLVLSALLIGSVPVMARQEEAIPANLVVPPGHVLFMQSEARGVQIYTCQARADSPGVFEWVFRAPEAELMNSRAELIGQHYAGPTWEGHDGSKVVGMALANASSPSPGAIPWLLLQARSTEGAGIFSTVSYIQRLNTAGGQAPTDGCDSARGGQEARVDYTATYTFYYPTRS
jgi:hypothetical protein